MFVRLCRGFGRAFAYRNPSPNVSKPKAVQPLFFEGTPKPNLENQTFLVGVSIPSNFLAIPKRCGRLEKHPSPAQILFLRLVRWQNALIFDSVVSYNGAWDVRLFESGYGWPYADHCIYGVYDVPRATKPIHRERILQVTVLECASSLRQGIFRQTYSLFFPSFVFPSSSADMPMQPVCAAALRSHAR